MDNNNQKEKYGQSTGSTLVAGMYEDYFLDYASYVILERAVPSIFDGLKPVQRRILHALRSMDDGRFHKVANVIGQTMQFHPHGDAAIGDALVKLGQKNLLIDCQGNWGDTRTGDRAAAPRYIEARLTKFALEIAFNAQTTHFQLSYDGRKKEPINLPVKFPLVLAQGVDGIAVGLSTKLLPHNFRELIKASINCLKGRKTSLYPDFETGGMIDVSAYNDGKRGGKVRVRAKISQLDKKTLIISEIPYSTTTTQLIDSIIKATNKSKIKIKKVTDNTAKDVEIRVDLPSGVSPDVTIDALYAFTDCEVSISPNACVIINDKPHFLTIYELLQASTDNTKNLLKWELENKLHDLEEKWHFASLEKIFIEERIYRDIEECETWEEVIVAIDEGLKPHIKHLVREVTEDDIVRLTEIKIKRISKFNKFKADEIIKGLEEGMKETRYNLEHLTDFAIAYFENLLEKYGKGRERKTEITSFDTIKLTRVVAKNAKLYVNRAEGFVGFGIKNDEFICECSDIDDVIVFRKDGKFNVIRISDKAFVGKDILHVAVWKKGDERTTYNAIYLDAGTGKSYAKRFNVKAITRDKDYDLTKGSPNSKILYFSANPNGEAETVTVQLTQSSTARKKKFEYSFADIEIKGRGSQGNTLTKYPVSRIKLSESGQSTLKAQNIWYDATTGRINTSKYGQLLGAFDTNDMILVVLKNGSYELTNFELTNRYDFKNILLIEKFNPESVLSVLYYDGSKKTTFVKRFIIETRTLGQSFEFISDTSNKATQLLFVSSKPAPKVEYKMKVKNQTMQGELSLAELIEVKGWKSIGNQVSKVKISITKEIIEAIEVKAEDTEESSDGLKPGDSIDMDLKPDNNGQADLF